MMRKSIVTLSCMAALAVAPVTTVIAAEGGDEFEAGIARLIRQLGSDNWREREAATNKLIEMGLAVLPAVRKATADPDPEISLRGMYICRRLTEKMPELLAAERAKAQALRAKAQAAFERGNYERMGQLYTELAGMREPDPLDVIWLGHAHQLAGDWANASAAYKKAARAVDDLPKKQLAAKGRAQLRGLGKSLVHHRTALMRLAGLIQREQLKDPRAAADTFTEAAAGLEQVRPGRGGPDTRCGLLAEAAGSLEQAGDFAAAIRTWDRIRQISLGSPTMMRFKVSAVVRLLKKLPAGKPPTLTPGVIVLTPRRPRKVLDLDDAKTAQAASAHPQGFGRHTTIWSFSFVPQRGLEFVTLEVEADMEKGPGKTPAVVDCVADFVEPSSARAWVGQLFSARNGPAKREVRKRTFNISAGADVVGLSTLCEKSHRVHRLTVKASFRPRGRGDPWPTRRVYLRAEFEPRGGKATANGKHIDVLRGTYLAPGRCVFEYEHPDRKRKFRCKAEFGPRARVGLFVNLDSPFQQRPTNLRGIGYWSVNTPASNSLVRLPDGRWLFAFDGPGNAIMLSTSKDLVKWEAPRPVPFSSVFLNKAPSLFVDEKGTIWLAWFSDRLAVSSTQGRERFRLWLSRSRDGRDWTRPVPISLGRPERWPDDPVQMFRGPKGRYWMFWRNLAASAESLDKISALKPISRPPAEQVRHVRIALDEDRRMKMVFNVKGQKGLFYAASADGQRWSDPVHLVESRKGNSPWAGQLILKRGRACLIYQQDNCGYVCPVTLAQKPTLGQAVKITNWHTRLNATTARVTKDGQVVLLVGTDAVWLLKARLEDLLR